jgi:hypothetical protein
MNVDLPFYTLEYATRLLSGNQTGDSSSFGEAANIEST